MKRIFIIFAILLSICGITVAQRSEIQTFQIALNGSLISSLDPSKLIITEGDAQQFSNFATLTNFEYNDNGIQSVPGMTKITSSALLTHPRIRNIFQFIKDIPNAETHILTHAFNSGETESKVFRHSTPTPDIGAFTTTALHTDVSGVSAGAGRFSDVPQGHVIFCNGAEAPQVWGGLENKPGYFAIFDGNDPSTDTVWIKDYTTAIWNNLTDSENVATLKRTTVAYQDVGIGSVTCYVANTLPIQGIKFYVGTANNRTGTVLVDYWNGSTLTAATNVVDGTSSGGIPLAQTGIISFDSTEDVAKVRIIEGVYGYFYRLIFPDATDTATISQVTVDEPFQKIRDFWDGDPRTIASLQIGTGTIFTDGTINVFRDEFSYDDSTEFDESTYISVDNKGGSGSFIAVGFNERMTGLEVKFIPDKNNTVNSVLTVSTWEGENWQAVSDLIDGTFTDSKTFRQSGIISWTPRDENVEFRRTIGGKKDPLFYYQLTTNNTMQGTLNKLFVYHINGIPAQKSILNYGFSLGAQGRTWLFDEESNEKNSAIVSAIDTLNVFNGNDTKKLLFGDGSKVTAAIEVHTRTSIGSRTSILVFKNNATFLIEGSNPEDWKIRIISNSIGCNAPLSLAASSIGLEFLPLQSKQVVIWQSNSGLYLWDSTSIILISDSISNYFDQTKPEAIKLSRANKSNGFFEVYNGNHYYHWLFTSKATSTAEFDKELVFDLRRQKFFAMDRSGNPLQAGTGIVSTSTGNTFAYGALNNGNLERLNNGTDFDGNPITSIFHTGDIILGGNVMELTRLMKVRLVVKSKTTTTNSISLTHYIDGKLSGNTTMMSPSREGYRLAMPLHNFNGIGTFHSIRGSMTTSAETRGFEPLWLGGFFQFERDIKKSLVD
jgi:hypothetical protein